MSDNLRRYRAIRQALKPCYPGEPSGQMARHLNTLAGLISGIVGSKSSQLPSIATKVPDGAKPALIQFYGEYSPFYNKYLCHLEIEQRTHYPARSIDRVDAV